MGRTQCSTSRQLYLVLLVLACLCHWTQGEAADKEVAIQQPALPVQKNVQGELSKTDETQKKDEQVAGKDESAAQKNVPRGPVVCILTRNICYGYFLYLNTG